METTMQAAIERWKQENAALAEMQAKIERLEKENAELKAQRRAEATRCWRCDVPVFRLPDEETTCAWCEEEEEGQSNADPNSGQ